jgi:hypothetical protein
MSDPINYDPRIIPDLERRLREQDPVNDHLFNFIHDGSFLDPAFINKFNRYILNTSYHNAGWASGANNLQNIMSRLDRHGTAVIPLNTLNYGYYFITRPRLNLTYSNLIRNPILSTLLTENPREISFAIRMLLDTKLSRGLGTKGLLDANNRPLREAEPERIFRDCIPKCSIFDPENPFLVPLNNCLKGISGFPDLDLQVETTEGDFHSSDFTFAKGSDLNGRTQDLNLEFKEINGGLIMAIIYYWILMIAFLAKGICSAYPDDIYEQRLCYTCSIYRFVTDTSRTQIIWWDKATGCFPKNVPLGSIFNVSQGEVTISSASQFSIPFVANFVEPPNNPDILRDFNRLVSRYTSSKIKDRTKYVELNPRDSSNFNGIPFIVNDNSGRLCLKWFTNAKYTDLVVDRDEQGVGNPNASNGSIPSNWTGKSMTEIFKEIEANRMKNLERLANMTSYTPDTEQPIPDEPELI